MRELQDIVSESLLDDEDEIMGKAYDVVSNPFKTLARVDDSVYDNPEKFGELLKNVKDLVAMNSIVHKSPTNDKYKIAFNLDNGVTPRMYIKCERTTYIIRGEKLLRTIRPAVLKLTKSQGAEVFRTYGPYYIPNRKLLEWMNEFFTAYDEGCHSREVWNKYRGK
jgi:hypothetical protein